MLRLDISDMKSSEQVRIKIVRSWEEDPITNLYREAGWLKERTSSVDIGMLIEGSFLFAVAINVSSGKTVGMGRAISDGIADAYIQDLIVSLEWRGLGVGKMILRTLLETCFSRGISWIGLIAQPGTDCFYRSLGFAPMEKHIPMLLSRR